LSGRRTGLSGGKMQNRKKVLSGRGGQFLGARRKIWNGKGGPEHVAGERKAFLQVCNKIFNQKAQLKLTGGGRNSAKKLVKVEVM